MSALARQTPLWTPRFKPVRGRYLGTFTIAELASVRPGRRGDWLIVKDTHNGRKICWPLEYRPDNSTTNPWSGFDENAYVRAGNSAIQPAYLGAGGWAYSAQLWTLPLAGDWHWMMTGGGEAGIPANGGSVNYGLTTASGTPPTGSALSGQGGIGAGALFTVAMTHDGTDWTGRTAGDAVYTAVMADHGNTQNSRMFGFAAYLRPKHVRF